MHDDDVLIPENWTSTTQAKLHQSLLQGDVICWCGRQLQDGKKIGTNNPLGLPQGRHPSSVLTHRLMASGALAISPVLGIFRRSQALRTLRTFEELLRLRPGQFHLRPTMTAGNDMLLWLHAAEAHQKVFFSHAELSGHGHHNMSETVHAFTNSRALGQLQMAYANTQKYARTNRYGSLPVPPLVFHLLPGFNGANEDTIRRHQLADSTWKPLYDAGKVYRIPILPNLMKRDARSELGDSRDLPFIKDLLNYGSIYATDNDWLVLTNRDICVDPGALLAATGNESASVFYSHRRDSKRLTRALLPAEIVRLNPYPGADLFAMRKSWWLSNRSMFPDMVLGAEAWDLCLWTLMNSSLPAGRTAEIPCMIYHEWHESVWEQAANRKTVPSQVHNRRLAREFLAARHLRHNSLND